MKTSLLVIGLVIITLLYWRRYRKHNYQRKRFCDRDMDLPSHFQITISNQLPGITKTVDEVSKWGGTSWPHDFEGN